MYSPIRNRCKTINGLWSVQTVFVFDIMGTFEVISINMGQLAFERHIFSDKS